MSRLTELQLSGGPALANTASPAGLRTHHLAGRPSNNRHTPENFPARFWAKVDRRGADECWPWRGNVLPSGRGQVHVAWDGPRNVRKNAPVVAWELTHGRTVPAGLVVAHSCDCPNCVNPSHLSAVTQAENIRDSIRKGRYNAFGRQKLDATKVRQIRQLLARGQLTQQEIGQRFAVSRGCIAAIARGETWAHFQEN